MSEDKKFVRFSEIENYKYIPKIVDKYTDDIDLANDVEEFHISEKIHGSSICISNKYKDGPRYFTRNGHLLPTKYKEVMDGYDWKSFFDLNTDIDFAYGEIAGQGIQKGVDYGDKAFYIFDFKDNEGKYHTFQYYTIDIASEFKPFQYAPVHSIVKTTFNKLVETLTASLEGDQTKIVSFINPIEGNIIEGYVVRCLSRPKLTGLSRYIFKIKHQNFDEMVRKPKNKKPRIEYDYSDIDPYINENRIQSAMSKFPGYTKKLIGDVMREIVLDVKKDSAKDDIVWEKHYSKYINKQVQKTVIKECSV